MDIAFDETECFVCFRSDCGYSLFQLKSDVIVIPRYLADLTFSRASLWSLYGNLIGHFLRVTERIWHLLGLNFISHFVSQFASLFRSSCRIVQSVFDFSVEDCIVCKKSDV